MKFKGFGAVALATLMAWAVAAEMASVQAIAIPFNPFPLPAQPNVQPNTQPSVQPGSSDTYREPNGLFEISFPSGYTYQDTGTGIAFASSDQQFGGAVDYASTRGAVFTADQLEVSIKREYENRFPQITWQQTELQRDGSIRIDWTGRDSDGNQLDAILFVEQRGDTLFILNLFGVNAPFNNDDAEAIVRSYRAGG